MRAAVNPRPLENRADIAQTVAELRAGGRHVALVRWQGQAAWLKLAVPQPPAWRYHLLATLARGLCLPAIQPLRPHGGARGLAVEAARIAALRAAGLRAPNLLDTADDWLLLSDLGRTTLESLLLTSTSEARLGWWQRGARYLIDAHHAGQYLSQPFARNFVWCEAGGLGAIDFEDDAGASMSLSDAQARDWLPYCFSTAIHFADAPATLTAALDAALGAESPGVAAGVRLALGRTAWLRAARWLPAWMQRRDVQKTRHYGELATALTAV